MEPLLLVGLVVLIIMLYRQSRGPAPTRGGDMQLVLQNMLGMMQAQQTAMTSVLIEVGRVAALRDFKVKNKTVEVALRLPNNLILPIDSKWTATSALAVMGRDGRVQGSRCEGFGAHGSVY